jgi:hypothetical protein
MPILRRLLTLSLACALCPSVAPAQTLARPNWEGSGMSADLWWKHAILYQANPRDFRTSDGASALHGLTQRLDYLHSLGIDALLLTPIQPDATHAQAVDPAYGTVDDLDDLIHEASRRDIRVLLDLDTHISADDLPNVARFWLNRGIAGFHVIGASDTAHAQATILRKATDSYLGQRILIGDADPSLPSDPRQRTYKTPNPQSSQLLLTYIADPGSQAKLVASIIRPTIDLTQDTLQTGHIIPLFATDGPAYTRSMNRYGDGKQDVAIAKVLATILLATHADPLLYYGQELGVTAPSGSDAATPGTPLFTWDAPPPPVKGKPAPAAAPNAPPNAALEDTDPASLLNWYRRLTALHHGNATISNGATVTLNHDDQNVLVWVRKPQTVSPISPVLVVICNLSAQPVQLSLKEELKRLQFRGSFLRTVVRSDNGMGTMHLESMTVPPYTSYIGELRF